MKVHKMFVHAPSFYVAKLRKWGTKSDIRHKTKGASSKIYVDIEACEYPIFLMPSEGHHNVINFTIPI